MKWTKYRIFLAVLLVISGTASTLLSKWTTTEKAKNSIGIEENFNHPFLQASGYFLGEFLCLIIYYGYKYVQGRYVSIIGIFCRDSWLWEVWPLQKKRYGEPVKVLERRREIIEEIVIDPQNLPMTVISKSETRPENQANEDSLEIKSTDIDDDEEAKRSSDLVYSSSDETKLKIQETQTVKFKWTKSWLFIFPACCDVAGSSLLYVGLSLTSASSYQMIRGSTIIFTGLASRVFLRKHLFWYKWLGMLIILIGLFFVGSSDLNIQVKYNLSYLLM